MINLSVLLSLLLTNYFNIRPPDDMEPVRSTMAHLEALLKKHVDFCCNAAIYTARKATHTSRESDKQGILISCDIIENPEEDPELQPELQVDIREMHATLDSIATGCTHLSKVSPGAMHPMATKGVFHSCSTMTKEGSSQLGYGRLRESVQHQAF